MSWNASGTYSRPVTTVSPAVGGTTIDVADQNTYTADVATGINACLAKNGENAATNDLNLGSNQINSLADGSLVDDAATVGQVRGSAVTYAVDSSGAANSITLALTPALTAYAAGQVFRFKAANTNTGATNIDIDSVGSVDIFTEELDELVANQIIANGVYTIVYDGTRFQLVGAELNDVGFEASATSGSIGATAAQVAYATEDRDPGSNYASSYYTCPTDGIYHFDAQTTIATLDGGENMRVFLYKDPGGGDAIWKTGQVSHNFNSPGSPALITARVSFTGSCDEGDKISVYAEHTDSGTGAEGVQAAAGYNYFSGTRLNLG